MADYLFDMGTCSFLRAGHPGVMDRLRRLSTQDRIFMSVVTMGELAYGIQKIPPERQEELKRSLEAFASAIETLPVSPATARVYGEVKSRLRARGRAIPSNDLWVAATALAGSLILVTSDRHFDEIEGLEKEDWLPPPPRR